MTLALVLDLRSVQNFVVGKAAALASRKLETVVSIGRVDIGLFSRVRLTDFYVQDYQGDTLLFAGSLSANLRRLRGLELGDVSLRDGALYLRQTPDGQMNIQQLTERLQSENPKGRFRMSIRSVSMENFSFGLRRNEASGRSAGIDFSDLSIRGATVRGRDFSMRKDTIELRLDTLAFTERSGLRVDLVAASKVRVYSGNLLFDYLEIASPGTHLKFPRLYLSASSWDDYKDFATAVSVQLRLDPSRVSSSTLARFAPGLGSVQLALADLQLTAEGTLADLQGTLLSARTGGTFLRTYFYLQGLPDIPRTRFRLEEFDLSSSAADLLALFGQVSGREPSAALADKLSGLGAMHLQGRFDGLLSSFDARAALVTMAGNARVEMSVGGGAGRHTFRGRLSSGSFDLAALLPGGKVGRAALTLDAAGSFGGGSFAADVSGTIPLFEFNDYAYHSLSLNGRVDNRRFNGYVGARDANLDFDFNGLLDFNGAAPAYNFDLDLRRADLHRLHFNRRDSISVLRASLVAHASGRSADDLNGTLTVIDARYIGPSDTVSASDVRLVGENSEQSKYLSLRSDFLEATFRSRMSYRTIFDYFREEVRHYLPTLEASEEHMRRHHEHVASDVNDYSLLSVRVKRFNRIASMISPGLQIADSSTLSLMFNPDSERFSLKASSKFIEHNRMLVTGINLNAHNQADSLSAYVHADDMYLNTFYLPDLSVLAGAKDNEVVFSAGFSDTLTRTSALLGARAVLGQDSLTGKRRIEIALSPSNIRRGDKTWQIFARRITYDADRIDIDRFRVTNQEQRLEIDGVASRSKADSLVLLLRNFDLAPFAQAVERMGYRVEGRTNGRAMMKSVLHEGEISADILIDSMAVNDVVCPPLHLSSSWDMQQNRARLFITDRQHADTVIRGFYAPERSRYQIDAHLARLPLQLIDPVLSGVVSATEGDATARLRLTGEKGAAKLAGSIAINDLKTTVDFTGVTYSVPEATIQVADNRLRLRQARVLDPEGGEGALDFDLDLQHLSNISFSLSLAPRRMLVLNTTESDNDTFYGKVYASGNASISGDKMGVRMDIAATTEGNSSFIMPLGGASDISQADFVIFETPSQVDSTDNVARRKRLFEKKQRAPVSGGAGNMQIALALNVRPDLEFQLLMGPSVGDIRGRGAGTLNIRVNPRTSLFEMYGDYVISEGTYAFSLQDIVNKRFIIEEGSSIQWTGQPMDALLDITALYKLKASLQPLLSNDNSSRPVPVECVVNLTDRLSKPNITFDVRVPNATPETQNEVANALNTQEMKATQFFFLLAFNTFYTDNSAAGQSLNIGAVGTAATGLEFLSNQVSNWLSSDDYNIVIRYRPKNELSSDEFDIGFSSNLINDRLILEVEGNYVSDAQRSSFNGEMNNFMGEATVTWLIDRSGNLRLSGFTHTIDRFDENQGLQESGIGIYYKEDFNTFRDIVRNFKERFANFGKRKKRRRAEKERAAAERAHEVEQDPGQEEAPAAAQDDAARAKRETNENR